MENFDSPISDKGIDFPFKTFPWSSPGLYYFTDDFPQIFKNEIIPVLHRLFQKIEEEETLPNSFYEASLTLICKSGKNI